MSQPPDQNDVQDIVIVGAGAAGLATAIFARQLGARAVRLLDGAAKPGAKILVSGGSRCNVTNAVVTDRDFWGGRRTIIRRVLSSLPVAQTIAFFESIGVPLKQEPTAKLFPRSDRSRDVLDALLAAARGLDVSILSSTRVQSVRSSGVGFELETSRGVMHASSVVLATGGLSLPKTGSDGAGLAMARALGHTIVPTTPALAPLVLSAPGVHERLSGVAQDVELALRINGKIAQRIIGPMLWTHFGVSGPAALDMSRHWLRARLEGRETAVSARLRRDHSFESMETLWTNLASERARLGLLSALSEMVPASVGSALLESLAIDGDIRLAQVTREHRRSLSHALTDLPLPVADSRGYNYAEATAGGVALDEIEPGTMQSRKCKGLFLVGEMLDVDGRLGGFNFQWAWSSARTAAQGLVRRASLALVAVLSLTACSSPRVEAPVRAVDFLKQLARAELRPSAADFSVIEHRCGGEVRTGLATPPASRATWTTYLPAHGQIATGAAIIGQTNSSATFRIGISDDRIYEPLLVRTLSVGDCQNGWTPMRADVSLYGGRKLSLFYRPGEKAWRVVFSVNHEGSGVQHALWSAPGVDTDRESAKSFLERRRQ